MSRRFETIEEAKERLESIENMEHSIIEEFKESLDECLDMVKIGTLEYLPSRVLEAIDPVAFREEYLNHFNEEIGELTDEIKEMEDVHQGDLPEYGDEDE